MVADDRIEDGEGNLTVALWVKVAPAYSKMMTAALSNW
jgi:hypothetical protein